MWRRNFFGKKHSSDKFLLMYIEKENKRKEKMCGIVGYTGDKQAALILLAGIGK